MWVSRFEIRNRLDHIKPLPDEGIWLRWLRGGLGFSLKEFSCLGLCDSPLVFHTKSPCHVATCVYSNGFLNTFNPSSSPTAYRFALSAPKLVVRQNKSSQYQDFIFTLFGPHVKEANLWFLAIKRTLLIGIGKNKDSYIITKLIDQFNKKEIWSSNLNYGDNQLENKLHCTDDMTLTSFLDKDSALGYDPKQVQIIFITPLETKLCETRTRNGPIYLNLEDILLLIIRRLTALYDSYGIKNSNQVTRPHISRQMIQNLCFGTRLKVANLEKRPAARRGGPTRLIGKLIFSLPASYESLHAIRKILRIGQLIGIGRGTIEGRGTYYLKFS